jgi:hypothetical protein
VLIAVTVAMYCISGNPGRSSELQPPIRHSFFKASLRLQASDSSWHRDSSRAESSDSDSAFIFQPKGVTRQFNTDLFKSCTEVFWQVTGTPGHVKLRALPVQQLEQ